MSWVGLANPAIVTNNAQKTPPDTVGHDIHTHTT